jgi:hypothetical protein
VLQAGDLAEIFNIQVGNSFQLGCEILGGLIKDTDGVHAGFLCGLNGGGVVVDEDTAVNGSIQTPGGFGIYDGLGLGIAEILNGPYLVEKVVDAVTPQAGVQIVVGEAVSTFRL